MTKKIEEMTKAELLELVTQLQSRGGKRKEEVLTKLREGYDSIQAIAESLNIERKNVSSILSALRKEGYIIITYSVRGSSVIQLVEGDEAAKYQ